LIPQSVRKSHITHKTIVMDKGYRLTFLTGWCYVLVIKQPTPPGLAAVIKQKYQITLNMKNAKKQWVKPELKPVQVFCECTAYCEAV
jgi:hypothetical protein